jgi:N6-adenosine-specific RNA methylase IME4
MTPSPSSHWDVAERIAAPDRTAHLPRVPIVADPPWHTMAGPLRGDVGEGWQFRPGTGAEPPAALRHDDRRADRQRCPWPSSPADDCALYLWTINAYLEQVYDVARAWGFKPSTMHTWCKKPMGGGLGGAHGISTEYFLYARKGSPVERRTRGRGTSGSATTSTASRAQRQARRVLRPRRAVNDGPYVELFARRARLGWDYWGDQSLGTAEMVA